jgi:2-polyprenyl-3-methyl-5-hydroxy-6-metoxy-1,4-benzoquinol methylase
MTDKPRLQCQEIWKKDIMRQHSALLAQDCARFFHSQGDPVAAGVAVWVPCVFCGGETFKTLFHQQAYRWERCNTCGLLQKRPRPHAEAMSRFYSEGQAVPFFEEKVLRAEREVRAQKIFAPNLERLAGLLAEYGLARGALLDIGCASGLFLAAAQNRALFSGYAGVEPNAPSAAEARKLGFHIYEGMFEEVAIPPQSYDVITCFAMFQFIQAPRAFLQKCRTILRPGGLLIFTSSNGWSPDILLLREASPVLPCHMLQLPDPESFAFLCAQTRLSEAYVEATGQLDVQIVKETWEESPPAVNDPLAEFLYRMMVDLHTEELAQDLQTFLKKANLSGHLWMQARNL